VDGQTGGNQITSAPGASIFAILGIVVVLASVIGGFLMEKGHILVLMQPAELLIIAGAAMGTPLEANPAYFFPLPAARLPRSPSSSSLNSRTSLKSR
jgi:chemotaxis protein MotA